MARNVGTFKRSIETAGDTVSEDDFYELDYSSWESFASPNVITNLELTVETPPTGVTAPTLGAPDYSTDNKPVFRISGGSAGDVKVRAVATNGQTPARKAVCVFVISTE